MAASTEYLAGALKFHLPFLLEAFQRKDDGLFEAVCAELSTALSNAVRMEVEEVLPELVHVHDFEYDDEGGYICSCGERA